MMKYCLTEAHAVMMSTIPDSQRRREMKSLLREARAQVTDAARYDFMKTLEEQNRIVQAKKRGKASAKLEKAPKVPEGAKVIPIRRQ